MFAGSDHLPHAEIRGVGFVLTYSLSQNGHRMVTEWSQNGHRMVTEWSQNIHRITVVTCHLNLVICDLLCLDNSGEARCARCHRKFELADFCSALQAVLGFSRSSVMSEAQILCCPTVRPVSGLVTLSPMSFLSSPACLDMS